MNAPMIDAETTAPAAEDRRRGEGHLPTDWLASILAGFLHGQHLAPLLSEHPWVTCAQAAGDTVRITVEHYPPLGQGPRRVVEHRELRLSPPLLLDAPPAPAVDGLDELVAAAVEESGLDPAEVTEVVIAVADEEPAGDGLAVPGPVEAGEDRGAVEVS